MKYVKLYEGEELNKTFNEYLKKENELNQIKLKVRSDIKNIIKKFFDENPEILFVGKYQPDYPDNLFGYFNKENVTIEKLKDSIDTFEKYDIYDILLKSSFRNEQYCLNFIIRRKINMLKKYNDKILLEHFIREQNQLGLIFYSYEWQDFQLYNFPETIDIFIKKFDKNNNIYPEIKEKYADLFDSTDLGLL